MDSADQEAIEEARKELRELLDKNRLRGIPLLVLGNKCDLSEAMDFDELIQRMFVLVLRFVDVFLGSWIRLMIGMLGG